jgi:hypothetical protein
LLSGVLNNWVASSGGRKRQFLADLEGFALVGNDW